MQQSSNQERMQTQIILATISSILIELPGLFGSDDGKLRLLTERVERRAEVQHAVREVTLVGLSSPTDDKWNDQTEPALPVATEFAEDVNLCYWPSCLLPTEGLRPAVVGSDDGCVMKTSLRPATIVDNKRDRYFLQQ